MSRLLHFISAFPIFQCIDFSKSRSCSHSFLSIFQFDQSNYFQAPRHALLWFRSSCFLSKSSRWWSAVRQFENAAPSRTIPKYFDLDPLFQIPIHCSHCSLDQMIFLLSRSQPLSPIWCRATFEQQLSLSPTFPQILPDWNLIALFTLWNLIELSRWSNLQSLHLWSGSLSNLKATRFYFSKQLAFPWLRRRPVPGSQIRLNDWLFPGSPTNLSKVTSLVGRTGF